MSNCTPSDINYFLLACLSSRFSWIRLSPQNNQMRLNHHTQETHTKIISTHVYDKRVFHNFYRFIIRSINHDDFDFLSLILITDIIVKHLINPKKCFEIHSNQLLIIPCTVFRVCIPLWYFRYPLSLCYRKVNDVSSKTCNILI